VVEGQVQGGQALDGSLVDANRRGDDGGLVVQVAAARHVNDYHDAGAQAEGGAGRAIPAAWGETASRAMTTYSVS
jgi:hypothetical protein